MGIIEKIDSILNRATQDFDGRDEILMEAKKEILNLLDDYSLLQCLRAAGVDNWEGWDDAIDMYNEVV